MKSNKGTRKRGYKLQKEYKERNPICELCRRRPTVELDHIVQKFTGTYETWENYVALCKKCHDSKHKDNLRMDMIHIKVRKGEWFANAAEEKNCFGKCRYFDARDI